MHINQSVPTYGANTIFLFANCWIVDDECVNSSEVPDALIPTDTSQNILIYLSDTNDTSVTCFCMN